ncbi:MAG: hypothetical protein JWN56_164 [Sphingobacteriales bacterium]|nr:hypothetical protein [Sphingobacteriales bacterium]
MKVFVLLFVRYLFPALVIPVSQENRVIQFDLRSILNARPVTTLTNNKLVIWKQGIDGGGKADGYLTHAAAIFNGDVDPLALPDNSLFPANEYHPEIKLHYSNKDTSHNQAYSLAGASVVSFAVPAAKYSDVYLALTSSEGASFLEIQYTYTDGIETRRFEVPDYYQDLSASDPDFCYLAHNLAKWGTKNNMTEKDHHNIDLLNIHSDAKRTLKGLKLTKNEFGYLVLWAATGVIKLK